MPTPVKGLRWIILAVIFLGGLVLYMLRTNLSIVSVEMMHDLGMNEYQLGLVFSALALGYALFQFPGGIVGDRFGPRLTITVMAIAWTVLTVATAIVPGVDSWSVTTIVIVLVAVRFVLGAFQAPFFPVTIGGTVERWFQSVSGDYRMG